MYNKILVANRGEIALRIIRACRELNIRTVAVYSKVDELSLHTKFADEAICIGPPASAQSYLNIPAIIAAAELTNADAIHPGYGFLAESAKFSGICADNNIEFIGPPPETIDAMGNKAKAKESMRNIGVPVIYGSDGIIKDMDDAVKEAEKAGYPIMLKASAGGGGRGMRFVENIDQLENAFNTAQSESEIAFSNGDLYLEKFIEESPSAVVNEITRQKMYDTAISGAKAVNYVGAGTIEFLLDVNNNFFFMEMNTRIQVEHPVTEMVTGADLIKYQILCHAGIPLPNWMKTIKIRGHSIECRINAEDPDNKFRPSPGKITSFHMPGGMGIRVDTHVYAGYEIPPNYDSMIAKLIVHAPSRKEAINRMIGALDECVIEGIKTIIPFQKQILSDANFQKGDFNTGFLDDFYYKPGEQN